jgi:hypothetical protein
VYIHLYSETKNTSLALPDIGQETNYEYLGITMFSLHSHFEKNRVGLRDHVAVRVCVCVFSPIATRQRLGRNVTAVTNTHVTIEELLEASFSTWPVSYHGK